jgi:hypothetical protein
MGKWYKVTKRINGRLYDYWQRTYRVGKSVKTENKYIGPAFGRNDRVLLVHKDSGARQERTIRNVLPDGYTVVDDVSGIPYKATRDTWEITLVKKGDPDACPRQTGMTFKELADQEAEALFKDKTFYHGTAAFGQLSLEKANSQTYLEIARWLKDKELPTMRFDTIASFQHSLLFRSLPRTSDLVRHCKLTC